MFYPVPRVDRTEPTIAVAVIVLVVCAFAISFLL
jgi:hypothetical protein